MFRVRCVRKSSRLIHTTYADAAQQRGREAAAYVWKTSAESLPPEITSSAPEHFDLGCCRNQKHICPSRQQPTWTDASFNKRQPAGQLTFFETARRASSGAR
jgi:hypothetical protein